MTAEDYAMIEAMQADIDMNEAADAFLQESIDANTAADAEEAQATIYADTALQADIDQNEADSDSADAALQAALMKCIS